MDRTEREARRDTFLARAEAYDAARPGYPSELLAYAVEATGTPEGGRVLEIGCGTGQATGWLAERGFRVLAVDRSAEMIEVARRRHEAGPPGADTLVEFRHADAEDLAAPAAFHLAVCSTSYHWLDPDTRARRCASFLVAGGGLALLWNTHPPPHDGFFAEVQEAYEAHVPDWPDPPTEATAEARIRGIEVELEAAGAFASVERRTLDWHHRYAAASYLALLATYSDHARLPDERRRRLFGAIAGLIDTRYDGAVTKRYRSVLVLGTGRLDGGRRSATTDPLDGGDARE